MTRQKTKADNTFPESSMDIQVDESVAYVRISCVSECIAKEIMEQLTIKEKNQS